MALSIDNAEAYRRGTQSNSDDSSKRLSPKQEPSLVETFSRQTSPDGVRQSQKSTTPFKLQKSTSTLKQQRSNLLVRSKSVTLQNMGNSNASPNNSARRIFLGDKPMLCPRVVPLDLLFFRRIFSNLHRRYGNGHGEVPVAVFQRSVVRLFRVLGMHSFEFDASEYDVDDSGAVGWFEFVTCWRKSKMSVVLTTAERLFLAMEDPSTCFCGQLISGVVTILIFVSCLCFIIGTMPSMKQKNPDCQSCEPKQLEVFDVLEIVCVAVFTMEYVARLSLAPLSRNELLDYEKILEFVTEHEELKIPSPCLRLTRFVIQPMNIIDFVVIVPFYLELFIGYAWGNLTVLRVLRLTRLFRLVKLGRYFEVLQLVVRVFNKSLQVLNVLLLYLILGVCFSSSVMYFLESGTWDEDLQEYVRTSHDGETSVTPFRSIPHSFWWCIVTFTTVGYGDVYPVTTWGKFFAAFTMLCGILVLAMPISAISMNFGEVWSHWVEERRLEAEARLVDIVSVTKAMQGMESRTRLVLEVRDHQIGIDSGSEFLGEVEFSDLPIDSKIPVEKADELHVLKVNLEKKPSERISGSILVGYTWTPMINFTPEGDPIDEEGSVKGVLEVRIQRAEGLVASDWKKNGLRDSYVVVHCWPTPPRGLMGEDCASTVGKTDVVTESLDPVWGEELSFEFNWPKDWKPVEAEMFGHQHPTCTRKSTHQPRTTTPQMQPKRRGSEVMAELSFSTPTSPKPASLRTTCSYEVQDTSQRSETQLSTVAASPEKLSLSQSVSEPFVYGEAHDVASLSEVVARQGQQIQLLANQVAEAHGILRRLDSLLYMAPGSETLHPACSMSASSSQLLHTRSLNSADSTSQGVLRKAAQSDGLQPSTPEQTPECLLPGTVETNAEPPD